MAQSRGVYVSKTIRRLGLESTNNTNVVPIFMRINKEERKKEKRKEETRKEDAREEEVRKKEVNMLLIGQTGVGKSTFINALGYYLNCKDLREAKAADLQCLIPCSFILTDDNYEERVITYGNENDENENTECRAQSGTRKCKSYLFEMDRFILRIIDTPGIGDTRGIDQDKLNMENILEYISPFNHLHAICILLKANESRLTATFEYCIKQLLCHLHKNASKNIIFLFTNSRGSSFRPGDSIVPLKEILNKLNNSVEIPLNSKNMVCLDNEAFRYLIALKNNFLFQNGEFNNINDSWKKSVKECWNIINLITDKQFNVHETEETLTLNQVKEIILSLAKPLSEISQLIQQNYVSLNKHLLDLKKYKEDGEELKSKLYVPETELKIEEVTEPRTVCSSETCRKIVEKDGIMQYHYPKICHNPCYLGNVPRNTIGREELRQCSAMGGSEFCKICKCNYQKHLHVYYLTHLVEKKNVNENTKTKLNAANGSKKKIEIIVKACEERRKKLSEEENVIIQNSAKLTVFLKENAILTYNDAFGKYIKELIEIEESLQVTGANNDKVIKGLRDMLDKYMMENNTIIKSMVNVSNDKKLSVKDAKRLIDEILNMEIGGVHLKSISEFIRKTRAKEVNHGEIKVSIKIKTIPEINKSEKK